MVTLEEEEQRAKRLPRTSDLTPKQKLDAAVARAQRPKSCGSTASSGAAADGVAAAATTTTLGSSWPCYTTRGGASELVLGRSGDRGVIYPPASPEVPTSYPRPHPFTAAASPFAATLTILRHSLRRRLSHTAGPKRRPRRRYSRTSTLPADTGAEEAPQLDDTEREKRDPPILVFRRIARIVRMLCCVCLAIRKYAIDAGYLDNYQVSVSRKSKRGEDDGEGSQEEVELTFNIKDFKLRRELAVAPRMVALLEKKPVERTAADIHAISLLMRGLPSFRKYTMEMQQLFSKIVRYMKCGKRRVVLRKGHIGYNLYFIYSGSVSVVLDKDDGNVFVKPEVVLLRKGACFGEIALLQSTRRTATIVCAEETEFLVIDKDDFIENGLNIRMQEEFRSRYLFFRQWPPLDHWTDDMIKALSYVGRQEEFHHNKVIVRDSTKNEWIWFVVRGSCNILRLVDLESCPEYRRTVLEAPITDRFIYGERLTPADICRRAKSAKPRLQSSPVKRHPSDSENEADDDADDEDEDDEAATTTLTHDSTVRPQTSIGFRSVKSEPESAPSRSCTSMTSQARDRHVTTNVPILEESPSAEARAEMSNRSKTNVGPTAVKSSSSTSVTKTEAGCGIFVKIDTLRDGQCFGLEMLFDEPVQRLSLISQGCEVIHLPRAKFKEMADRVTTKTIHKMLRKYPPDNELCRRFLETSKWDSYKREVVESVVAEQQRNGAYENMLRHNKRVDYLHDLDKGRRAVPLVPTYSATTTIEKPTARSPEPAHTAVKRRSHSRSGRRCSSPKTPEVATDARKMAGRATRPRTCPPNVSRKASLTPAATATHLPVKHPTTGKPPRRLFSSTELPTTTYFTRGGYQVEVSNLQATGSKRTLQLVQTVKSPSHESRMALLRMK